MAILEVNGLVKIYKGRKVVDGVNFEVNLGEAVGLLGGNGAGKTTSFRMATGQVAPDAGRVSFNGNDVTALPMFRRARLGMGYLDQMTSVFRKLTVEENVLAVLEMLPASRSLGRKLTRKERLDLTDQMLTKFGLSSLRKNNAARLSGGEKRRLEIARCLVCEPLLILLDEPFTGIDPNTITDIEGIIKTLRAQGIGILITDHQAREILKITDRVYLIHQGKVFLHGTPQEVANNEEAIKTYLGHTAEGLTFSNGEKAASPTAIAAAAPVHVAERPALRSFVEQDRVQTLLDRLRTEAFQQAALELLQHGPGAIPLLVDALMWRDTEMRRRAYEVLQRLWPGVTFDPFAPEGERLHRIAELRAWLERRAG